jgi:hypothetical protein
MALCSSERAIASITSAIEAPRTSTSLTATTKSPGFASACCARTAPSRTTTRCTAAAPSARCVALIEGENTSKQQQEYEQTKE